MTTRNEKAAQFVEDFLTGALNSVVRAGAKAVESIASDAKKALRNEAKKIETFQTGVKSWREGRLGDISEEDEGVH